MRKLTLFILNSGRPDANPFKTKLSLRGLVEKDYFCANNHEIMVREVETDWFMILYDNEVLDREAKEALPTFFEMGDDFDYISFYKKNGAQSEKPFSVCPRIFKKGIKLLPVGLIPKDSTVLNGTVCLNGFIEDFQSQSQVNESEVKHAQG